VTGTDGTGGNRSVPDWVADADWIEWEWTDDGGDDGYGYLRERVHELAREWRRDRERFDPPADPPADERAMSYLREGVGPVVMVYVEARTGGRLVRLSEVEFDLLHAALNGWLGLYARCYGVEADPDVTVREAAEVLLETHNVRDTAQLLTHVPAR
jgi:hypothetical protein